MYRESVDVAYYPTALTRRLRSEVFVKSAASQRDTSGASSGQTLVGSLSIENFVALMRFVLLSEELDTEERGALQRLRSLLRSVEALQLAKRGCEQSSSSSSSNGTRIKRDGGRRTSDCSQVTALWSVWDAAQFCVATKLKTPLGARPDYLFYTIDARLRALAERLTADTRLLSLPSAVSFLP